MGTMALQLVDADNEQLEISIPEAAREPEIMVIPWELITPDPEQPRVTADAELRAALAKQGLLQPVTVRPHPTLMGHYMLVDGERRWRSAEGVLSTLRSFLRTDLDAASPRLAVQLVANTAKPLSPLEEAQTYKRMLAEHPEWTVSELAKELGRPRSTVAQRLEALELGAWLDDVASGALSWTMLVETLLPYRGCPDKVHAAARDRAHKDQYRWRKEESPAIGPRDFENVVKSSYKPALYPLNKSKNNYGAKNPEFNTKHHDAECECGGILVADYAGETPRKYCGNPGWWGPQHRKAMKDKPKAPATSGGDSRQRAVKKELRLPKGSVEVTGSVHEAPPEGCAWLTTAGGSAWSIAQIDDAPGFDPVVLQKHVKPQDLVLVRGGDTVRVATTNLGAMKKAQAAFAKRVQDEAATALKPMRAVLKKHTPTTGISGVGVQALLAAMIGLMDQRDMHCLLRAVCAIEGIAAPAVDQDDDDGMLQWAGELSAKDAKAILTAVAALGAAEYPLRSVPNVDERGALRAAADRKVPWLKDVKESATAAAEKQPAKKGKGKAAPVCIYCICSEDNACEGGCTWISKDPPVCSSPACQEAFEADNDALRGGGDDDADLLGRGAFEDDE